MWQEQGNKNMELWHCHFDFGGCKIAMELHDHTRDLVDPGIVSKGVFTVYTQIGEGELLRMVLVHLVNNGRTYPKLTLLYSMKLLLHFVLRRPILLSCLHH